MKSIIPILLIFIVAIPAAFATPGTRLITTPPTADLISPAIDRIEKSILPILIPERTINLVTFAGHAPDRAGAEDFRPAIQRALKELSASGGGTLHFPHTRRSDWNKGPETYRIRGYIQLGSNTRLLLDPSVILRFEFSPQDYTDEGRGVITRYEGTTVYGHAPLIRAFNVQNIVIEAADGTGAMPEITGDGDRWVAEYSLRDAVPTNPPWKFIRDTNEAGTPLRERRCAPGGPLFARPDLIQFFLCRNVRMEGVKLSNSPFWVVHPVFSSNLTFRGLLFDCQNVNNDGIDPDSSRDVLIENILFNNHDDNVAVKSGRDREGREGVDILGTELASVDSEYIRDGRLGGPTENVLVRKCVFKGHYALCIGSEMSGGVRHIYAMDNSAPQDITMAVFIKSSRRRGGTVEHIYVRNFAANLVRNEVIAIIPNYDGDTSSAFYPTIRHVSIEGVTAQKAGLGIRLFGWPQSLTEDVRLRDIRIALKPGKAPVAFEASFVREVSLKNVTIDARSYDGDYSITAGPLPPTHN